MLPRHDDTTMIPAVVAMMAWIEDTSLRQRHTHKHSHSIVHVNFRWTTTAVQVQGTILGLAVLRLDFPTQIYKQSCDIGEPGTSLFEVSLRGGARHTWHSKALHLEYTHNECVTLQTVMYWKRLDECSAYGQSKRLSVPLWTGSGFSLLTVWMAAFSLAALQHGRSDSKLLWNQKTCNSLPDTRRSHKTQSPL